MNAPSALDLSRRLANSVRAIWLRYRQWDAERAACEVEADMLTAPTRLIELRARVTDLNNALEEIRRQS